MGFTVGVKCWIDIKGIECDKEFEDIIINAINDTDIFLFMYSHNSAESIYAGNELKFATQKKKRIVFINIDDSSLTDKYLFSYSSHDFIYYHENIQKNKLFENLKKWTNGEDDQIENRQLKNKLVQRQVNLPEEIEELKQKIQDAQDNIKKWETDKKQKEKELKDIFIDIFDDKMIFVEGGKFRMGPPNEPTSKCGEVTVDAFWIGETPVTQSDWNNVMKKEGSLSIDEESGIPKTNVTYQEVVDFIKKLNEKVKASFGGKIPTYYYCLPTEAEWEYAAKEGNPKSIFRFSGSNDPNEVAHINTNENDPRKVKLKKANRLGIYDMSGNVREWCHDIFEDNLPSADRNNPRGPKKGKSRVVRGGDYCHGEEFATVFARQYQDQNTANSTIGFRLVRKENIIVRNEDDLKRVLESHQRAGLHGVENNKIRTAVTAAAQKNMMV